MFKVTKTRQMVIGTTLVAIAAVAFAAAKKPEKTQGLEGANTSIQQFPLVAQIPAMAGYELRGRRITVIPSGAIVEHSHAERPGIVYIVEGSMTEHRGDVARIVKPGDTWAEEASTVHWFENTTDKPCVIWVVDLVKK